MHVEKSLIQISGKIYDVGQYFEILDFHEKDELIEMLEDVAFVYAIHRLKESKSIFIPRCEEKIILLQDFINAIRAVKPI